MTDAFKPIFKLLKVFFILAMIAYPASFLVQVLSPSNISPFNQYNHILSAILKSVFLYGDWFIVAIITFFLINGSSSHFIEVAEKIRRKRFGLELKRWSETPFISPLHLYYMVCPPVSYDNKLESAAAHPFYKDVVRSFRERASINAKLNTLEPEPEDSRLKSIGNDVLLSLAVCLFTMIAILSLIAQYKPFHEWFLGWDKFLIPFLLYLSVRTGRIIQAIIEVGSGVRLKKSMKEYFGVDNPCITWREVYPDTPLGDAILYAWKHDSDCRQLAWYEYQNVVPPKVMIYDNPHLAIRPFENDELPPWIGDLEEQIEQAKQKEQQLKMILVKKATSAPASNVIEMKRRKKGL